MKQKLLFFAALLMLFVAACDDKEQEEGIKPVVACDYPIEHKYEGVLGYSSSVERYGLIIDKYIRDSSLDETEDKVVRTKTEVLVLHDSIVPKYSGKRFGCILGCWIAPSYWEDGMWGTCKEGTDTIYYFPRSEHYPYYRLYIVKNDSGTGSRSGAESEGVKQIKKGKAVK